MIRSYTKILACLVIWITIVIGCSAEPPLPDENGLWRVWVSHTNAAADHAEIAGACHAFRAKVPTDPLVVVAQGLEAWHLLKAGKTNEAYRLLEPMVALSG